MKKTGQNSWTSWGIAVACSIIYCFFVILFRLQALFYAAIVEQYDIEREKASIPFAVMGFVRCVSGLIFGVLGERFGLQWATYFGCYLSALGAGLSYFASDIVMLSITLGLLYGFGLTGSAMLPSILRDYFDDSATTISNGILNIGPCICAFVFPAVIIYFLDQYGVPGAFLLSSGIIINSIPLIMLVKKPKVPTIKESNSTRTFAEMKTFKCLNAAELQNIPLSSKGSPVSATFACENKDVIQKRQLPNCTFKTDKLTITSKKRNFLTSLDHSHGEFPSSEEQKRICLLNYTKVDPSCSGSLAKERIEDEIRASLNSKPDSNGYISNHIAYINVSEECTSKELPLNNSVKSVKHNNEISVKDKWSLPKEYSEIANLTRSSNMRGNNDQTTTQNQKYIATEYSENETNKVQNKGLFDSFKLLKDSTFIALTVVQSAFYYTFYIFLATMIDYSRDKKIDRCYEIYILTLNPITDAISRLGLAWVVDKGYISVSNFGALLFVLLTISSVWMALAQNFAMMTSGIMLMTFSIGAFTTICPGMSYAFIEKDKQILSITSIGFLYAPLSLTVPSLIGYFRGKLGSYDGLFYFLAVKNLICGLIVLLLPKLASMRERRKLEKEIKR